MNTVSQTPWSLKETLSFPPLSEEREVDLTIVGGGFTGLALAYHLNRLDPKMRVCLLEAEKMGSGASGRTGGILMNGTASDDFPGTEEAIEAFTKTCQIEQIECDLRMNGCYEMARDGSDKVKKPRWRDEGFLEPVNTVAGGDFHPQKYLNGLVRSVTKRGIPVYEKTPVVMIQREPYLKVITPLASIQTKWLLLATNTDLLSETGLKSEMTPYQTYAIGSEPLSREILHEIGWEEEKPFYTLSLPFLWGRTTVEGRIIVGSGLSSIRKIKAEMFETLTERFHNLHPALENVKIEYHWSGPICIPHDWTPKIRTAPGAPQILYLGGYAGHGNALSQLFAKKVAEWLTGDREALRKFSWAQNNA